MQHAPGKRANNFCSLLIKIDYPCLKKILHVSHLLLNFYIVCSSDSIAGLSAFVDGNAVMSACGCGPSATSSTTATTAPNFLG